MGRELDFFLQNLKAFLFFMYMQCTHVDVNGPIEFHTKLQGIDMKQPRRK